VIGTTISHYRILEKLGEGGMGVVYKARDTHLDRFVAIKVLPPEKVANADRKARFVQEARSASALNHPNIVTIHDIDQQDGIDFMAMEFVAGKTLDELIPRKGMRLGEALKIAVQVAGALSTAHEAGIIHRDLKPGNIILGDDGRVRVLDFGLAKLTEVVPESDETRTVVAGEGPHTEEGTILGTASYMSPEQAEGKKVDARSDIFSFGSVLYEMVTGHRPFQGDSNMSTLGAIIHKEPSPLPAEIPHDLQKILNRCLRKDPERRFQYMKDLRVELEELKEESESGSLLGVSPAVRSRRLSVLLPVAIILSAVAVLAVAWLWFNRSAPAGPEAEMSIVPFTTYAGREDYPDFSPDGTQVAFNGNVEDENNTDIYVRMIGSAGLLRLTTDPAWDQFPRWSPDGRSIAFLRVTRSGEKNDLMVLPSIGGPERKIAEIGPFSYSTWPPYFDWAPDGTDLVVVDRASADDPLSLYLITATGDERRRLTSPPSGWPSTGDRSPSFSSDGRFLAFARESQALVTEIYSLELSQDLVPVADPMQLTLSGDQQRGAPAWAADGRDVIYRVAPQEGLWRLPSDGSGEPSRLAIAGNQVGSHAIDPVRERLVFSQGSLDSDIWRMKLSGAATGNDAGEPFIASSRQDREPHYSPDGQRVAFTSARSGTAGIWICDADGENAAALFVPESGQAGTPRWSPDGSLIAFDSNQEGQWDIYLIRPDGGTPMALTRDGADDIIPSWSRDGKWVYFSSARSGRQEIWKSSADGTETVQVTRTGGGVAFESLDGKRVYYTRTPEQISSLWRAPVDGGEEQHVLDAVWNRNFTVTEGGIYFVRPPKKDEPSFSIRRLDPNTEEVEDVVSLEVALTDPGRGVSQGLAVSPKQRSILYTQWQRTSDLMLVENFR
jgi:eukaryotic-like serine/threonine-protein kinase